MLGLLKRRRKKLSIFLGCTIAAVLLLSLWREREPRYKEHSLGEWVWMLDYNSTGYSFTNAEEAIEHIGTDALPFLIKWIQYEEKPWRQRLGSLCDKLPTKYGTRLNDFVVGRSYVRQIGAFSALYILGSNASPAVPTLARLVTSHPSAADNSLTVLARIGGDGLALVLDVLTNQASLHRFSAINALNNAYWTSSIDPSAVPVLTHCLDDTNREIAIRAAQILCSHETQKEPAMKTLVDALGIEDKKLRGKAAQQLTVSLKRGYSIPALLQFLQDTNSPLSPYAARAFGDLAHDDVAKLPDSVLSALIKSLHDPRPRVRSSAASALDYFGEAAEPAASALLDLWNDPDELVRKAATNAFFELPAYARLRAGDVFVQTALGPPGMSPEQEAMYRQRYGLPPRPTPLSADHLLSHPDPRIRQMATNAFLKLPESTDLSR